MHNVRRLGWSAQTGGQDGSQIRSWRPMRGRAIPTRLCLNLAQAEGARKAVGMCSPGRDHAADGGHLGGSDRQLPKLTDRDATPSTLRVTGTPSERCVVCVRMAAAQMPSTRDSDLSGWPTRHSHLGSRPREPPPTARWRNPPQGSWGIIRDTAGAMSSLRGCPWGMIGR